MLLISNSSQGASDLSAGERQVFPQIVFPNTHGAYAHAFKFWR